MGSGHLVFAYPNGTRRIFGAASVLLLALLIAVPLITGNLAPDFGLGLLGTAFFLGLANLQLQRSRVVLSSKRIQQFGLGKTIGMEWSEIDDLHCSPRLIVLTAAQGQKRIKLVQAEYGLSIQPFEVLREEIRQRVEPRLAEKWTSARLPIAFEYPGLSWGTRLGYLAALGLVLLHVFLLILYIEGLWIPKLLFLGLGVAILVPLYLRDHRRSRRKLILREEGLLETDGTRVAIPWQNIERVLVREPLGVGYGSIIVTGRQARVIRIPRSLPEIGILCHMLRRRTGVQEEYGHER